MVSPQQQAIMLGVAMANSNQRTEVKEREWDFRFYSPSRLIGILMVGLVSIIISRSVGLNLGMTIMGFVGVTSFFGFTIPFMLGWLYKKEAGK